MSNTNHTFHPTAIVAVNEALVVLGQDVLLDELSQTSESVNSRKAAYLYESARKRVLGDHNWNFATTDIPADSCKCGCDSAMPYVTQKPARCVCVIGCFSNNQLCNYCITGKEIRSDLPIDRISYIQDVEDLDRWTADAYRALVLRLAADLAKPITGRINERQLQEEAYANQISNAKLADAKESNIPYDAWGDNYYVQQMRGGVLPKPNWRR